jgi:hypothetical protein
MIQDFTYDAEDEIRKVWVEERPMVERIHDALVDGMGLDDDEADMIIALHDAGKKGSELSDDELEMAAKYSEAKTIAEDILDEDVESSLANQDKYYDAALEDYRDNYSIDDDSGFWTDIGLRYMSDVANEYNLDWPIWTQGGDEPDGSYDYGNAEMLARELAKALGIKTYASGGYHSGRRDDVTWIFEPDSSLDADDPEDMPVEVISPPMPLLNCLEMIEKFFKWAEENGAYSNSSTGFHMGVSIPFKGGTVDYIKLALFLGDEYVLQEFGRQSNHFCEAAMKKIRNKVSASHNKGQIADALDIMRNNLLELATKTLKIVGSEGFGKYTSINPHVNGENGYIEFRSAGGREYMDDIKKLQNTLMRYAQAMYVASRPDLEREEYYKKLYKLISPQGNDSLNLFAQYATGSIDKDELKKSWAKEQLTKELGSEKKANWKLYNKETGTPVPGAEFGNYTEEEAWSRAKSKYYTPAASMAEFKLNYDLRDISTNTGRWSIIRRDNEETLEIVDAPTRGEATDYARDKYTDVIPFYVQPYSGEKEPEPKLSPRAKLAKRITTPKDATAADLKAHNYEFVYAPTGRVLDQVNGVNRMQATAVLNDVRRRYDDLQPADIVMRREDDPPLVRDTEPDVAQNFTATPGSTPWRDQLAQTIRDSAPRGNWELYIHNSPDEVFHTMRNSTAEEVRQYIDRQETNGMPPGFLRVRQV